MTDSPPDSPLDFETVFEAVDIPTVILDADGTVVVWNGPLEELLDIPKADVVGVEDIGEVVYDGDRRKILAEKVLEHPERADEVYDVGRADTEYALLRAEGVPTYEDTSTATGGSGADIWFLATPLYRADEFVGVVEFVQRRADSERRRREMEHLIDELVGTLSAFREGDYTARVEHDFAESIVDEDEVEAIEEVNDLARIRSALRQQVIQTTEAKRELERRNEQLERFASVVAHDLRNPLQVAEGRLAMVEEDALDDETADHVGAAQRSLGRMETLIDELLTLARAGEVIDDVETVDLDRVSERAWDTVAAADATLQVETGRTVAGDETRLEQLLSNLFRNAVDHGRDDVTVTVGDLEDGFYVADDGPGIPSDEREQVFESGFTTSSDGTGFGLVIVDEIADAHGWTVRVTEGTDGGARFEFDTDP